MNKHIIFSYKLANQESLKKLSDTSINKKLESKNLLWIHMDADHPKTPKWLEAQINHLDPFIRDALIADETRPRMTQIGDGLLLILRGVNLNENAAPEDMVSIRLWVNKLRIISVQKRNLKAVNDIVQKIEKGKGPKNSGEFIAMLTSRLFARMEPSLSELDDAIDGIEEKILETAANDLREDIIQIRKQAIMFRRYMSPQRDAVSQLRNANLSWLNKTEQRHLLESYNHITRYVEDLDALRERAQIIKDELANILADKLNKNMYLLSVIVAIFLPLGFLTGLFGVNLGGMPGVENHNAFEIFSGTLAVMLLLQIILFKKFKWF